MSEKSARVPCRQDMAGRVQRRQPMFGGESRLHLAARLQTDGACKDRAEGGRRSANANQGAKDVKNPASRRGFLVGSNQPGFGCYWTETRVTPARIMPNARAAGTDRSITRPRTKGPRSLTRHWMVRPPALTVRMLPNGLVR
jgi:hypothetical protein